MIVPIVAVPARNEEERLPDLMASLAAQTIGSVDSPLRIVVALNNTTDSSRRVLAHAERDFPQLRIKVLDLTFAPDSAHAGSARRAALECAREWIGDTRDGVLLTTDADAVVASNWVEGNLAAIAAGADLVGGRIYGDAAEEALLGAGFLLRAEQIARYSRLADRLTSLIDPLSHDPWPRHQDHTGASLAVRVAVYDAVGGMPALPFREDLGFVQRVIGAGFRLVHPHDVKVVVSARLQGRASGGMADCISSWVKAVTENAPIYVEAPSSIARRAQRRRQIRNLLGRPLSDWTSTLAALNAAPSLLGTLRPGPQEIARLIQILAPDEPDAPATTPVHEAFMEISARISDLELALDAA